MRWNRTENPGTEREVKRAISDGLVDVVEALLGEPPKHMYDYGMQAAWRKRAYQWIADQRRPPAIYPIHFWSAGYGCPQAPATWFRCKTCGEHEIGQPHELPKRCGMCVIYFRETEGWEVADAGAAAVSTHVAAQGMPAHSLAKVLDGPGRSA